jgi:AcrR family transcriptional regulator
MSKIQIPSAKGAAARYQSGKEITGSSGRAPDSVTVLREFVNAADNAKALTSGGRPRSESSRLALLEAAYSLMRRHPVSAISTQQIANQAGVSTATVYRWWPTKESLLLDAFLHVKEKEIPLKEEGSPLERLREHAIAAGRFFEGENGRVAARILTAIQDDKTLREAFTEQLYLPQSNRMMKVAQEAIKAGELPPGTDLKLFLDTLFGSCLVKLLMRHESVRRYDTESFFDFAVAGARSYWAR